jgi:predicted RNase H-like nuclease (RuvC/YqgF family)
MASSRFFQDGVNSYNGFVVNVVRFVGAYDSSESGRTAAKHWGTIETPDGEIIDMGVKGMTTPQIKKKIEKLSGGDVQYTARDYNRGGDGGANKELNQLMKLREQLESVGIDTAELDAKIEAKQAEIEANRQRDTNAPRIKELRKKIAKMEKIKQQMLALGCAVHDVDADIARLEEEIAELS